MMNVAVLMDAYGSFTLLCPMCQCDPMCMTTLQRNGGTAGRYILCLEARCEVLRCSQMVLKSLNIPAGIEMD